MGIEAASIGKLSDFGPRLEGSLSPIVNEGPVGLIDLKNTMPLQIGQSNPISKLRFDSPAKGAVNSEPLSAESVIAEANYWLRINNAAPDVIPANAGIQWIPDQVRDDRNVVVNPQVEPVVTHLAVPDILQRRRSRMIVSSALEPGIQTKEALGVQVGSQSKLEGGEEVGKEEVVTEKETKREVDIVEEEISKEKKRYLVDELPLARRIYEGRQAVKKAKTQAKELGLGEKIIGTLVARFMPTEHTGIRSSIVQPNGPDGSYEETIEAVKAGQFDSEDQVEDVVLENTPVKEGKDGKPVKDEAVWKVLKHWVVKHVPAHEIVTSRVVKKRVQAEEVKVKKETNLEELSPALAAVFQKVA